MPPSIRSYRATTMNRYVIGCCAAGEASCGQLTKHLTLLTLPLLLQNGARFSSSGKSTCLVSFCKVKRACWKRLRWRVRTGGAREISICLLATVYTVCCWESLFLFFEDFCALAPFGSSVKNKKDKKTIKPVARQNPWLPQVMEK